MQAAPTPERDVKPESLLQKRWRRFRSLKRGWYSFVILCVAFGLSFFNPLWINSRALVVSYEGQLRFPVIEGHIEAKEFDQREIGEARYRKLKQQFAEEGEGNFVWMPLYPYDPLENLLKEPDLKGSPPHAPTAEHWMGTDDRGRDVFARLVYGFRVSLGFGIAVLVAAYSVGITVGALLRYFEIGRAHV